MGWQFIHIVRRTFQGDDHWGEMYLINKEDKFEKFCYTYELPWRSYDKGALAGKSVNQKSRIRIGIYPLTVRADGPKGWRLELKNTGHRSNIQIHRAHSSLYLEGCILPMRFNDLSEEKFKKGDPRIQVQSVALMDKVKARYEALKDDHEDSPTLTIAAKAPAQRAQSGTAYA